RRWPPAPAPLARFLQRGPSSFRHEAAQSPSGAGWLPLGARATASQPPRRESCLASRDSDAWPGTAYLPSLRRCTRVRFSILRCFFLDMRLRRFLITEPIVGTSLQIVENSYAAPSRRFRSPGRRLPPGSQRTRRALRFSALLPGDPGAHIGHELLNSTAPLAERTKIGP